MHTFQRRGFCYAKTIRHIRCIRMVRAVDRVCGDNEYCRSERGDKAGLVSTNATYPSFKPEHHRKNKRHHYRPYKINRKVKRDGLANASYVLLL